MVFDPDADHRQNVTTSISVSSIFEHRYPLIFPRGCWLTESFNNFWFFIPDADYHQNGIYKVACGVRDKVCTELCRLSISVSGEEHYYIFIYLILVCKNMSLLYDDFHMTTIRRLDWCFCHQRLAQSLIKENPSVPFSTWSIPYSHLAFMVKNSQTDHVPDRV